MDNILVWQGDMENVYMAKVERGTLYVDGDDFATARDEMRRTLLKEWHPGASEDDIDALADTEEFEKADQEAWDELIDTITWSLNAIELEPRQSISETKINSPISAWIETEYPTSGSLTFQKCVYNRDWEAVAAMLPQQVDDLHKSPTLTIVDRDYIRVESAKDGQAILC